MKELVYIIRTRKKDARYNAIKKALGEEHFEILEHRIIDKKSKQIEIVRECLCEAKKILDVSQSVTIIFDTVIPAAPKSVIRGNILDFIRKGSCYDIAYLHKYMDECQKYRKTKEFPISDEKTHNFYRCFSPKGLYAAVYTAEGRKRFMKTHIEQCKIKSVAIVPNLFQYDISSISKSIEEYNKTSEFKPTYYTVKKCKESSSLTLLFLLFLLIALFCFLYIYYMYS